MNPSHSPEPHRPGTIGGAPDQKPNVLVVEDDAISALVVRRVLEDIGYTVEIAENGHQALELHRATPFKIIVSDWMMPEMDGVELCREVRNCTKSYTYFILLTAKSQREERNSAFEAGVDDMLSKPLDRDELISRLLVAQRILSTELELRGVSHHLRLANSNLEVASRRFEELFQRLPVACFTIAADGLIHEWNREAESSFGVEAPFAFMRSIEDVLGDASAGFWNEQAVEQLFEGRSFENCEWSLETSGGSLRHFVGSTYPFKGPNGQYIGVISANVDITDRVQAEKRIEEQVVQLAEMNRKLELLSITDGLTGLRNHRYFQEALGGALAGLTPEGRHVSVIFIDVDHFKKFNDTYGHVAGDDVLKSVAGILRKHVKEPGIPARYGGEEFAVVLPGMSGDEAIQVAEKLRAGIENHDWQDRTITASFGIATTNDPSLEPKQLIELADDALYESKNAGRNQIYHADWRAQQSKAA